MTAEISPSTRTEATQRAEMIRLGIVSYVQTRQAIVEAYQRRDWVALDYQTWDAYVAGEFGEARLRLPREQRQEAVTELRLAGMSTRAIASVVGTDEKTVRRDLSTAAFAAVEQPERVTGVDGRERPAVRPTAPPRPSPAPVAEPVEPDDIEQPAPPSPIAQAMREAVQSTADNQAEPSAAVAEWLAADPNLALATWRKHFCAAITRITSIVAFTPDAVAEKADEELMRELHDTQAHLADYIARIDKLRPTGLRIVGGGR